LERAAFLAHVRKCLDNDQTGSAPVPPQYQAAPFDWQASPTATKAVFVERLRDLGVAVTLVATRQEAQDEAAGLIEDLDVRAVASWPCTRWSGIHRRLVEYPSSAQFGLCDADWAIAESGSLVLQIWGDRDVGVLLLPPTVGFFVPQSRLFCRLGDVLRVVGQTTRTDLPPRLVVVTGPSATADIVGIRITGMHGPGKLYVWLIADE
jgi:L-lactate dehydrogenase complex protein LldG